MIKILVWGLYIVGGIFLMYPFVSNGYQQFLQKSVVKEYQENVVDKDNKELKLIQKKMAEHNDQLVDQQAVMGEENFGVEAERSVQKGVDSPKRSELGDVMAVLDIPKINLELPIYYGTNSQQISNGAGVMQETSLPFGGTSTHSVITSHRGLPTAKLFTDLPELKLTDLFFIKIAGETHAYEVDRIKVIEPDDFSELEVVRGRDYVTLLTCTPYMVNTHRLLVRGHRVTPYTPGIHKQAVKTGHRHQLATYAMYVLVVGGTFTLFCLLKWYRSKQKISRHSSRKKQYSRKKVKRISPKASDSQLVGPQVASNKKTTDHKKRKRRLKRDNQR